MEPPAFKNVWVVGIQYRDFLGKMAARALSKGDSLICVRQPSNPHDSNAISVHSNGVQIGYLSREDAGRIAPWMDSGVFYMTVVKATRRKSIIVNMFPIKGTKKTEIVTTEECV